MMAMVTENMMSSVYGGSIKNGIWVETDHRYIASDDCPKPDCYACQGSGSYWCGMVGCIDSEKLRKSREYQQKLINETKHCRTCKCEGRPREAFDGRIHV